MNRLLEKCNPILGWVKKNPIKTILVGVVGAALIVALILLIKHVVIPFLLIAVLAWVYLDLPLPMPFASREKPTLDIGSLRNLMLDTLSELYERIGVYKPFDTSSIIVYPQIARKGGVDVYRFKADCNYNGNASIDEYFLEQCRLILQARLSDRLNAGTITGLSIPACFYQGIPSLYVDEVRVHGQKLLIEIVFVADDAERNYVLSRMSADARAQTISTDDVEL